MCDLNCISIYIIRKTRTMLLYVKLQRQERKKKSIVIECA